MIRLAPDSYKVSPQKRRDSTQSHTSTVKGYMQAAKIFANMGNNSAGMYMIENALERLADSDVGHVSIRSSLEAQRDALHEHRKRTTCHLAVLPVEILSLIFEYGAPREEPDFAEEVAARQGGITDNMFVIRMGQVCRHWRQVATGHARLWQTLVFGSGKLKHKVKAWSTRAGGSIREFVLLPSFTETLVSGMALQDDAVNTLLRRELHAPPTIIRAHFGFAKQGRIHHCRAWLELVFGEGALRFSDVEFRFDTAGDQTVHRSFVPVLDWQAHLQRVSLAGGVVDWTRISASMVGLRSLCLANMRHIATMDTVLSVLGQNPLLRVLQLDWSGGSFPLLPPSMDSTAVVMPQLEHLAISGQNWSATELLKHLRFPSLRTFVLGSVGELACNCLRTLNLGPADEGRLERLYIRRCQFTSPGIISALESKAAGIKVLEISRTSSDLNAVVDALAGRGRGQTAPICANITQFNFKHADKLTGSPIKELVKSRLSGTELGLDAGGSHPIHPSYAPLLRWQVSLLHMTLAGGTMDWDVLPMTSPPPLCT